jgi:UDP-N-acetylglucosamine diphosphorylase/glucosamine-1-phosphate N-acetyltransferase
MYKLYVTILAGGMGKRMQSNLPKVLHQVKGKAMIVRLLQQVLHLKPDKILIVVGKFHQEIQDEIEKNISDPKIYYINQPNPHGTGDAVKCTLNQLIDDNIVNIILNGDMPMVQYQTIKEIYDYYLTKKSNFLITSINLSNPSGNGRIIIDESKKFKEIIEEKDCSAEQKIISLVNCGIYIISAGILKKFIPLISNSNAQSEYYLTDLVKIYTNSYTNNIELFILEQSKEIEIYNINTREQLEFIENY